ncbi:unnamed protein product [Protopolystoma xenopodis]|uniref:Uncharacterized protein n=1 Tax=Protopolystoma xenopodis TaxID=117903 RepID=A0A448WN40_9PLAT|nr:unnamed protein product [Protopolystoma xenopodis]
MADSTDFSVSSSLALSNSHPVLTDFDPHMDPRLKTNSALLSLNPTSQSFSCSPTNTSLSMATATNRSNLSTLAFTSALPGNTVHTGINPYASMQVIPDDSEPSLLTDPPDLAIIAAKDYPIRQVSEQRPTWPIEDDVVELEETFESTDCVTAINLLVSFIVSTLTQK